MSTPRSAAERLDHALDGILGGMPPAVAAASVRGETPSRQLVVLAGALRTTLVAPPVAPRFEARLGARLAAAAASSRNPIGWARRHPGKLLVTGAVGSAVGVGVTAYAVWRNTRRHAARRPLHR
jgi:hypothetical protein